jgi:chromosome partitioning protein
MKTILITSQKGGSGKTMLAAHLSVEAERSGNSPVWIIDTDKQGTLTRWHERREQNTPELGVIRLDRIMTGLATLQGRGASYCFIDTPPTVTAQTKDLIDLADLILIPVRPSPSDLWAVTETLKLVKAADKPFLFVITQAKPQASITAQAIAALSKHGRVAVAFVSDRVAYAAAMAGGNTAPELQPKGAPAAEVSALWQEVKTCFHENMKVERIA